MRASFTSIAIIVTLILVPAASAAAPAVPSGDPLATVEALHRWQALALGEAWTESAPQSAHALPSEAIIDLVARHGGSLDPTSREAAVALDALDAPLRDALVRALNAHLDYDSATRAAFAAADLSRVTGEDGAALAVPDVDTGALGLRFAPVLSARMELVRASVHLGNVLGGGTTVSVPPVQVSGIVSIDLRMISNVYAVDYAFQIDGGGSDLYLNNAGGSGVPAPTTCLLVNSRPASALLDLGPAGDEYGTDTRKCGVNGGGASGAGFLYDEGGSDVYRGREWGVNGGAAYGLGLLLDMGGRDVYLASIQSTNGGGMAGAGLLVDLGGDDLYSATRSGTNGGAAIGGVGTLYDASGNDRYYATDGGANGGGNAGVGLLLDMDGTDLYSDLEGGSGTDRTVVPKGAAGAQLDRSLEIPTITSPPIPAGAPTFGPDNDRDGIPATMHVPQAVLIVDPSGARIVPLTPMVVALDPNDGDPNHPARVGAPYAGVDWGCAPDAVCVRAGAALGALGADHSRSVDAPTGLGGPSDAVDGATGHRPYSVSGDQLIIHPIEHTIVAGTPSVHADGFQSMHVGAGTVRIGCDGPASASTPRMGLSGFIETNVPSQTRAEHPAATNARCTAIGLVGASVPLVDVSL